MLNCLMLAYPEMPPVAETITLILPTTGEERKILTFGAVLTHLPYAKKFQDFRLNTTIMWCLAYHPEERPTFEELLTAINLNVEFNPIESEDVKWTDKVMPEPKKWKPVPALDRAGNFITVCLCVPLNPLTA